MQRRKFMNNMVKTGIAGAACLSAPAVFAADEYIAKIKLFVPAKLFSDEFYKKFSATTKIKIEIMEYLNFKQLQERAFNFLEGDLDLIITPSEYIYALSDLGFIKPLPSEILLEKNSYPELNNWEGLHYRRARMGVNFGFEAYGMAFDITQFPISKKTSINEILDDNWQNGFGIVNDPLVMTGLMAQGIGIRGNFDWDEDKWGKVQAQLKKLTGFTEFRNLKPAEAEEFLFAGKVKLIMGLGQTHVASLIKRRRKVFNFIPPTGGMLRGISVGISKYSRQEDFCMVFINALVSARMQALMFQDLDFEYNPVNPVFWNKLNETGQDIILWRGMAENAMQEGLITLLQKGKLTPLEYPKFPERAKIEANWNGLVKK